MPASAERVLSAKPNCRFARDLDAGTTASFGTECCALPAWRVAAEVELTARADASLLARHRSS